MWQTWRRSGKTVINARLLCIRVARRAELSITDPFYLTGVVVASSLMTLTLPDNPWFYRILNLLLLAVLAWHAAGFLWLLLAPGVSMPAAAPAAGAATHAVMDLSTVSRLFAAPAAVAEAPSALNYKLRGVIASHGQQPAAAVLQGSGPAAVAVKLNGELESGVKLVEVASGYVIVDNHGRRERIELDAKAATLIGGAPAATSAAPAQLLPPGAQSNTAPPAGMPPAREERVLTRQQLAAGMQSLNVADWAKGLADVSGGGILVENPSAQPLAPYLGLQSGDVLKSVNGAPLNKVNDISNMYGAFSRDSQITISLVRNGTPLLLKFRVPNAQSDQK